MKRTNFPINHPGLPYREKGEQALSFGVFYPPCPKSAEADAEKVNIEEHSEEILGDLPGAAMEADIPPVGQRDETVTNKDLMDAILGTKNMMVNKIKEKPEQKQNPSENFNNDKLLLVQGSKSIVELCLRVV